MNALSVCLESTVTFPVITCAYGIVSFREGHCATSRKAAGSIPGRVIGTFHRRNPSGRNMASHNQTKYIGT